MTPETYMRRFHTSAHDEDTLSALPAEEVFPSCPLEPAGNCSQGCDQPEPTSHQCCCKSSMVEALRLLCGTDLAALVDFDAFFFLTDSLAVGGTLAVPAAGPDNIDTLNASFQRFSPCNCDLIDVAGTAYYATPGTTTEALEAVEQLALCSVKAISFALSDSEDPAETEASVYRRAIRHLRRAIQSEGGSTSGCGSCGGHCNCDDCCCDAGILAELATRNLSRQATLTIGPLVLQNVTVLGTVGSTLVLANEAQRRIYFVCASQVEALG